MMFQQTIDSKGLNIEFCARYGFIYLQGFEKIINESKANATEALKNIELIKALIKEANETAINASSNADMASSDANKSRDLARKANATTEMAKEVMQWFVKFDIEVNL